MGKLFIKEDRPSINNGLKFTCLRTFDLCITVKEKWESRIYRPISLPVRLPGLTPNVGFLVVSASLNRRAQVRYFIFELLTLTTPLPEARSPKLWTRVLFKELVESNKISCHSKLVKIYWQFIAIGSQLVSWIFTCTIK